MYGINIFWWNGKATSGKVTLAFWVYKTTAVFFVESIESDLKQVNIPERTTFLSHSGIVLGQLPLGNWVEEQRDQ